MTTAELAPRRARPGPRRSAHWLLHLVLILGSTLMLMPFGVMLLASLMPKADILQRTVRLENLTLQNYVQMFSAVPFGRFYLNSLIVAVATVTLQILTASLAAFAFARLRFRGREAIFVLYLATLMIPSQVTMIPNFILMRYLRWYNTYQALILPSAFSVFSTFLLRQYFMAIPNEFEEAAMIDGASPFQVFYRIYLPLVSSVLAVLAVLTFNSHWNEFFRPLIFMVTKEKFTIPLGLFDLQGYMMTGSISTVLAGIVLSMIPVFIVYLFGQRYLIEGIMMGGLKA